MLLAAKALLDSNIPVWSVATAKEPGNAAASSGCWLHKISQSHTPGPVTEGEWVRGNGVTTGALTKIAPGMGPLAGPFLFYIRSRDEKPLDCHKHSLFGIGSLLIPVSFHHNSLLLLFLLLFWRGPLL
jgi:hypothetical protein